MRKLIYVAGPYSADTEAGRLANVQAAIRAGHQILAAGHYPVIPHLSHYVDVWCEHVIGHRLVPEIYMEWDFVMLRRCDGLLFLGSSPGAERERELALTLGLPIWTDARQIPEATDHD